MVSPVWIVIEPGLNWKSTMVTPGSPAIRARGAWDTVRGFARGAGALRRGEGEDTAAGCGDGLTVTVSVSVRVAPAVPTWALTTWMPGVWKRTVVARGGAEPSTRIVTAVSTTGEAGSATSRSGASGRKLWTADSERGAPAWWPEATATDSGSAAVTASATNASRIRKPAPLGSRVIPA